MVHRKQCCANKDLETIFGGLYGAVLTDTTGTRLYLFSFFTLPDFFLQVVQLATNWLCTECLVVQLLNGYGFQASGCSSISKQDARCFFTPRT